MTDIVATVNGTPIDSKALGAAMQSFAQEQFHATLAEVPEAAHGALREMALERLIARELIYQAALAEGLVASADDVAAEKARIVRMTGNPKDFWSRLAERGMDEAAFDRMVRKDVTADLMTARKLQGIPDPEGDEVVTFFHEHHAQLCQPERVRVSHILFPIDPAAPEQAMDRAREVMDMAQDHDFKDLARNYSACPSAPGGGDLGFVRREDVDSTFADAIFSHPLAEVGGPVKTSFGVHLFMVTERDIPGPPTLEESRPKIINVLKRIKGGQLLEAWVAELRQSAEIVIHS